MASRRRRASGKAPHSSGAAAAEEAGAPDGGGPAAAEESRAPAERAEAVAAGARGPAAAPAEEAASATTRGRRVRKRRAGAADDEAAAPSASSAAAGEASPRRSGRNRGVRTGTAVSAAALARASLAAALRERRARALATGEEAAEESRGGEDWRRGSRPQPQQQARATMPDPMRPLGCWKSDWAWDDYISVRGIIVWVDVAGAEVGDGDLGALLRHLASAMRRHVERTGGKYILNMDLSCNRYISDDGICDHLAPFLGMWPKCQRLKLYKTSVGDGALSALSNWVAAGYAHDLHLSDLGAEVTDAAVLKILVDVQRRGRYPYRCSDGTRSALWLRLEHNGIQNTAKLLHDARFQGVSLMVVPLDGQPRPGSRSPEVPCINLVLFHRQELRVSRRWLDAMRAMAPVAPELWDAVTTGSCASASQQSAKPQSQAWRIIPAAAPEPCKSDAPATPRAATTPEAAEARRCKAPPPTPSTADSDTDAAPVETPGGEGEVAARVDACGLAPLSCCLFRDRP